MKLFNLFVKQICHVLFFITQNSRGPWKLQTYCISVSGGNKDIYSASFKNMYFTCVLLYTYTPSHLEATF